MRSKWWRSGWNLFGPRNEGDVVRVGDIVDVTRICESAHFLRILSGALFAAHEHPHLGDFHVGVNVHFHHAAAAVRLHLDVVGSALVIGIKSLRWCLTVVSQHAQTDIGEGSVGLLGVGIVGDTLPSVELGSASEVRSIPTLFEDRSEFLLAGLHLQALAPRADVDRNETSRRALEVCIAALRVEQVLERGGLDGSLSPGERRSRHFDPVIRHRS